MVAHSLHRNSESLVNALEHVALHVVQEIMKNPFQAKPPLPYAFAAPESQVSPAYVAYKMGGDPVDHQFFSELPKEIPHGYMCAYIPDSNNPVYSAQQAVGGCLE
jgi:hypothetical protein